MKKALILCHRGSKSLERMAGLARQRGLEPVAITSACVDGGVAWTRLCDRLQLPGAVSAGVDLRLDDVDGLLRRVPGDYAFAFANWDGQRELMARLNERFGAADLGPAAVHRVQDKLVCRQALVGHGLSRLDVFAAASPQAGAALARGEALIVKPRRGAGSLLTSRVTAPADLRRLLALFAAPVPDGDLFSEFMRDNELIAETFFHGTEFSFEVVRSRGCTLFWCVHEKTRLQFTEVTVLERGFCSPSVTIDAAESRAGFARVDAALARLDLTDGCFHVEMLRDDAGHWEFVEINARIGGALIEDSVHAQYGRWMVGDWMDLLLHGRLDRPVTAPSVGTYMQFSYVDGDGPIAAIHASARVRPPDLDRVLVEVGSRARNDREEFAALCLWTTDRRRHAGQVAELAAEDYYTLEYGQ